MPNWLKKAVFYEIYPQSFYDSNDDGIGDIPGIIEKLDYVHSLGCNAIWMNPCYVSPFMDAGYDVADYKKVAPRYGTNEDLCRLFKTAHEKGMHILLDLVPGHTSEQHPWFQASARPEKNDCSDRYIWTDSWLESSQGFRFMSGRFPRNGSYIVNFFATQPALNYGFLHPTAPWQLPTDHPSCRATAEALKDIMRFWLDHGCDGFRVDMADSLVKSDDENKSATGRIWENIRAMLDADYPEAALVSEWCNPPLALTYGFHSDFYLDHPHGGYQELFRRQDEKTGAPTGFFAKNGIRKISPFTDEYLSWYQKTKDKGFISFITCNHDTPRLAPAFSEEELKIAYAFLFTMPGVPFLYYGDEIGMRYQKDLVSKEGGYTRTGSRTPMQWTETENLGFSHARPEALYLPVDPSADAPTVETEEKKADSLLNTVRRLLALRRENADLEADGPFEMLFAKDGCAAVCYRRGSLTLAVNPSLEQAELPLAIEGKRLFGIGAEPKASQNGWQIAPQSFSIWKKI